MGEFLESIGSRDPFLDGFDRAIPFDQGDLPALPTDDMVVVLVGINELILATGLMKAEFLHEAQFFEHGHQAENGGVIRMFPTLPGGFLEFFQTLRPTLS